MRGGSEEVHNGVYTSSVLLLVFEVSLSFAAGRELVQHLPLHRALPGIS